MFNQNHNKMENEKKFNDNTLNEFCDAVAGFMKNYDTKKNHAHIFCVITEEHGEEIQTMHHVKGAPLQIAAAIDNAINSNERLKTATLVHRLLKLNEIKKDKDNIDKALDMLKNLVK